MRYICVEILLQATIWSKFTRVKEKRNGSQQWTRRLARTEEIRVYEIHSRLEPVCLKSSQNRRMTRIDSHTTFLFPVCREHPSNLYVNPPCLHACLRVCNARKCEDIATNLTIIFESAGFATYRIGNRRD